ncbi:MAG: peptidylprolyl isomerase, partial [Pirellula sp.]
GRARPNADCTPKTDHTHLSICYLDPKDSPKGITMSNATKVVMKTSKGSITIELDAQAAPKTVENFLSYARSGHYNGTIFHRVISNFMIQGGGFTPDMKQKSTNPPIVNESSNGLSNQKYTLAMARTSVPDSATSQFFINVTDNDFLDKANSRDRVGYCVFGKVTSGSEVVEAIKTVATTTKQGHENVPVEAVVIESVEIAP